MPCDLRKTIGEDSPLLCDLSEQYWKHIAEDRKILRGIEVSSRVPYDTRKIIGKVSIKLCRLSEQYWNNIIENRKV